MSSSPSTLFLPTSGSRPDDLLTGRIYRELRRHAEASMRRERAGHTLQPTALVNEAYLRLFGGDATWESREHFFGAAAEAMRRVLVEHARKRSSRKRGGDADRVTLDELSIETHHPDEEVLALSAALTDLQAVDERLATVVKLRYFAGMTIDETAAASGRSTASVKRDWSYARAWLYTRMSEDELRNRRASTSSGSSRNARG